MTWGSGTPHGDRSPAQTRLRFGGEHPITGWPQGPPLEAPPISYAPPQNPGKHWPFEAQMERGFPSPDAERNRFMTAERRGRQGRQCPVSSSTHSQKAIRGSYDARLPPARTPPGGGQHPAGQRAFHHPGDAPWFSPGRLLPSIPQTGWPVARPRAVGPFARRMAWRRCLTRRCSCPGHRATVHPRPLIDYRVLHLRTCRRIRLQPPPGEGTGTLPHRMPPHRGPER